MVSAVIPAMSGAAALVPPTMFQTAAEPPPSPWLQMTYPVCGAASMAMSGVTRHWAVPLEQNPPGTFGVRPPRW